jgi:hypothetical protein
MDGSWPDLINNEIARSAPAGAVIQKEKMKKALIILVGIFAVIGCIVLYKNQTDKSTREAEVTSVRSIVEMYIKADLHGATLGTDNFAQSGIGKIIIPGEESSPGWDTVSLAKSYTINTIQVKKEKGRNLATASVTYELVGEVPGAVEVIEKKETENYVFRLVKQDKEWKLIEPYDLRPHVSIETVIRHLKTLLGREHQEKLPEVIRQLEKMKGNG